MNRLLAWWPLPVCYVWLLLVEHVAGYPAAFFTAITALAVAVLGIWEAGRKKS